MPIWLVHLSLVSENSVNFTHKAWINSWYGFQVLPNSVTYWDYSTRATLSSHHHVKSTMVKFKHGFHGWNANVLTTRTCMHSSLSNKLNIQFSLKSKICQLSQLSEQESPEGTCISLRIKTLYKVQVHAFTFWMGGGTR